MMDDENAIAGLVNIEFDAIDAGTRARTKGAQRVLRLLRRSAPMGDDPRSVRITFGVEGHERLAAGAVRLHCAAS